MFCFAFHQKGETTPGWIGGMIEKQLTLAEYSWWRICLVQDRLGCLVFAVHIRQICALCVSVILMSLLALSVQ